MAKKRKIEKLTAGQKRIVIEALMERKDTLERKLAKLIKEKSKSDKGFGSSKDILVGNIIAVKDAIDEVKKTNEYRICSECKKYIPAEDLEEDIARKTCKKCEKKARKKK